MPSVERQKRGSLCSSSRHVPIAVIDKAMSMADPSTATATDEACADIDVRVCDAAPTSNILDPTFSFDQIPPPADPAANPDDDGFRNFRDNAPVWFQNAICNLGVLRFLVDSLTYISAGPAVLKQHPGSWETFLQLSGVPSFLVSLLVDSTDATDVTKFGGYEAIRYGSHAKQVMHVWEPQAADTHQQPPKTMVFVHGGAWFSGFPAMYRLLAKPGLERGCRVAIVGYRTYPDTDVDGQADDVAASLQAIQSKYPSSPIVLMAHSTGCQVSSLALLNQPHQSRANVKSFIGLSGLYHVEDHQLFEVGRGLDQISPLIPANHYTIDNWNRRSPTCIVQTSHSDMTLPAMYFVHGAEDMVVPYSASNKFAQALLQHNESSDVGVRCKDIQCHVLKDVGHTETVMECMFGGKTQDVVFDLINPYS
eukprot:CAMPEP_0198114872 /NCGR_PEP_ID=MMETSP1442-20131203/6116_1 /TAXON_ID= /ORGANISM="Craspedostauros australis, Strain CCMP3328" /LENGTH=421 /DNA_ID=CAMNT_0043772271 /DNA_START=117 /DNA_END=1383 /DNA_ORIENTATION=+